MLRTAAVTLAVALALSGCKIGGAIDDELPPDPGGLPGDPPAEVDPPSDRVDAAVVPGTVDPGPIPLIDAGTGAPDPGVPAVCYSEPYDPAAPIADLARDFDGGNWDATFRGVLQRRWTAGYDLVSAMGDDPDIAAYADSSSFGALMASMRAIALMETRGWDYGHSDSDHFAYYVRRDVTFSANRVFVIPRSEILDMLPDDSTQTYVDAYLLGDQGGHGFSELVEEINSHVDALGAIAAAGDQIAEPVGARDGAVAFLYYLELYLERVRTAHPDLYARLSAEAGYPELVQTLWLRTHFFLQYADRVPALGIRDADIRRHLYEPDNQAEIEMFVGHRLAASHCLPN